METMVLVAGLAVAGVGGIAAAFYVSVRPPRSRGGWLRRADIDEELWPEDAFGGVTDEQFWDDLAADKPLATTARQPPPAAPPGPAASRARRRAGRDAGPASRRRRRDAAVARRTR